MLQKCYNIKIIEILLKKKSHIRELARDLKTNQTTIARKINELYKKGIVDYEIKGKNKVFYLKKNIISFQSILITEENKLIEILKEYPFLKRIVYEIKKNKKIKLAILFGSYAKKTPNKNSDIDIYIETQNKKIKESIEKINSKINVKIGKFNKNNLLIKEIQKKYIIIKGVERYYENIDFFEENL